MTNASAVQRLLNKEVGSSSLVSVNHPKWIEPVIVAGSAQDLLKAYAVLQEKGYRAKPITVKAPGGEVWRELHVHGKYRLSA